MNDVDLDRVFRALADPTRRGMLTQLADGESNISTLAEPYHISQPAISKHLAVLEHAGLVRKTKRGREQFIAVNTVPFEEAMHWMAYYAQFWKHQFDAVDQLLDSRKRKRRKQDG